MTKSGILQEALIIPCGLIIHGLDLFLAITVIITLRYLRPGYYSNDKTYFMQSNLFDKASQELMFSVQSDIFNPSSLASGSRTYISTLMKQLEKAKLLKK